VFGLVSGKKFRRTNIVAGYGNGKTIAECVYDCTTDGEVFNARVEQSLVASLKPRQVVAMDNAAFHEHPRTRKAIEAAGCSPVYLPPYSPDLNPSEKFWAIAVPGKKGTKSAVKCIAEGKEKGQDISEFSFEFNPKFFAGIWVWRIGREENQGTASRSYGIPRPPVFVKRRIIHDHHLPRL
jgi:transposase